MKLSVVIPAYNEEKRIAETLKDIDNYLETHVKIHTGQAPGKVPAQGPKQAPRQDVGQDATGPAPGASASGAISDYEIIVVVNGSKDGTYNVVKQLEATTVQKATAINLEQGGKGNAVKRGILDKATGDIILFMDADNATPISEIEKFLPFFGQGFDVVIGSRYINPELVKVRQPLYRIILSRLSNLLIQLLAVPGIKDTQLGFKAFSNKAAKDIFQFVNISRWGFDMEVLTVALVHGYKIKEVGVAWTEHGGGHVPLKAYLESFIDLIKIKFNRVAGKYNTRVIEASV